MRLVVPRAAGALLVVLPLWSARLGGQAAPAVAAARRLPVRVAPFPAPPVIDGSLDEPVWRTAARLDGFVQTQPGDNTAPSHPTLVLLGFDAHMLYVGLKATDDSARVRATVAPRDNILADDHITIFLDTFGDRRRAYVMTFNPLGIQQDGMYTEGAADPDYSVDIVMQSRGRADRDGWTVEVAIPLRSLRYAAGPERLWNVQVQRRIKHLDNEQSSWMPMVRGDAGFLTRAGQLAGLGQLPSRRAVELIPSVTASSEGARVWRSALGPDGFRHGSARADIGLSAKLGLAADVTAELALNPDFAQVEADAPVVTANQRFPILFAEKRPFFLEGVDLLRTPLLVVHTRAIVSPDAAVKMTGKRGATTFGVLAASDAAPGHFTDAERRDSSMQQQIARLGGRNSQVGIVRLRRDVGEASYIGVLGTGYHFIDRDNLTAGADLRLTAGTRTALAVQLTGTWARRPFYDPAVNRDTLRTGRGLGYYLQLKRTGRHLNLTLTGTGRSPDYVSETGFTPQVNTNIWNLETRWNSEPRPNATLISWSAVNAVQAQLDWQGRAKFAYVWPRLNFYLPSQTEISVGAYADYLRIFEEEFGGAFAGAGVRETVFYGVGLSYTTTPDRHWKHAGSIGWEWDGFDYDFGGGPKFPRVSPAALADPGAPLDPGKGRSLGASLSLEWTPAAVLRVNASYTKSRLVRNDTRLVAHDENLWSAQAVYQFTRFVSARLRADYRTSRSNLRPQLLLAWTPNPGTAVYAGYNDDLNRDGYSPMTGALEPGVHRNSRTVFVKMSYLLSRALP